MSTFNIESVNISEKKGIPKTPVDSIELIVGVGVCNDAHAGSGHREVSLLALEDIQTMQASNASVKIGDFAENITTSGIMLHALPIGTKLTIGECLLEVTQIGKECHSGCVIMKQVGDCIMPKRGIFARVLKGGVITNGNTGTYSF
jgi:cyclic pyranopterin monophosphate synthase